MRRHQLQVLTIQLGHFMLKTKKVKISIWVDKDVYDKIDKKMVNVSWLIRRFLSEYVDKSREKSK